ncbi:MAG: hypothetical protein VB835_13835 [Pirellulales bacterium]
MPNPVYFLQECPTCGRDLQIRIAYLAKRVTCRHCNSDFVACDPGSSEYPPDDSGLALLKRADELLASAESVRNRPR